MTPRLTLVCFVAFILFHASTATSPVVGPWPNGRTVSLDWTWVHPDVLELALGSLDPPVTVTEAGADIITLATGLDAWATGPSGATLGVMQTTLGHAVVRITPQGDLTLQLVNATGVVPFGVGQAFGWTNTERMRYMPQLRSLSQDMVLGIVPTPGVSTPVDGVRVHFATYGCGEVTMGIWTTTWNWPDPTYETRHAYFQGQLPPQYRPAYPIRAHVVVNRPQWSSLCTLVVHDSCGTVSLHCEGGGMTTPVTLGGDLALTWSSGATAAAAP